MEKTKSFTLRINRELWLFLKKKAADQDRSMTDIITDCLEKYKKKSENKLTD